MMIEKSTSESEKEKAEVAKMSLNASIGRKEDTGMCNSSVVATSENSFIKHSKSNKVWYQKNKDKISLIRKQYYKENKDKVLSSNRRWCENNKEKKRKSWINWKLTHPKHYSNYSQNRKKTDIYFLLTCRLRDNVRQALNYYSKQGKVLSAKKYGIDYRAIIEKLTPLPFPLEDRKNWHIDHIRPLNTFNLNDSEEIKEAFNPNNLRWLPARENLSRRKDGNDR